MNHRHSKTWSRLATTITAVYWIALVAGTHLPKLPTVTPPYSDKIAHFVAFAGLAFLLSWAWATRRKFFPKGIVFAFSVATLYGVIDELTQMPIPGRYGQWSDLLADTIGAALGTCLYLGLDALAWPGGERAGIHFATAAMVSRGGGRRHDAVQSTDRLRSVRHAAHS